MYPSYFSDSYIINDDVLKTLETLINVQNLHIQYTYYDESEYDFSLKFSGNRIYGKRLPGKAHKWRLESEIETKKEYIMGQLKKHFPKVICHLIVQFYAHFKLIYSPGFIYN